jgi:hypothetical protein
MLLVRFNKLLSFLGINFGIGLLQSWVLMLVKKGSPGATDISVIFSDGGLYFFSTSLAASSFYSLASAPGSKLDPGTTNFNFSLFLGGTTVVLALVGYTLAIARTKPFDQDLQAVCLLCAAVYAFYVAVVTNMFEPTSP